VVRVFGTDVTEADLELEGTGLVHELAERTVRLEADHDPSMTTTSEADPEGVIVAVLDLEWSSEEREANLDLDPSAEIEAETEGTAHDCALIDGKGAVPVLDVIRAGLTTLALVELIIMILEKETVNETETDLVTENAAARDLL
jgi:hypothetical protein